MKHIISNHRSGGYRSSETWKAGLGIKFRHRYISKVFTVQAHPHGPSLKRPWFN